MIWKFANTVLTGYSLYVLETTKYVKGFCLPSNIREDQPCSTRLIRKVKTHCQEFYKKNPRFAGRTFLRLLSDEISKIKNTQKFINSIRLY